MKCLRLGSQLLLLLFLVVGCGTNTTPTPTPASTPSPVTAGKQVKVEGRVVPLQSVEVRFPSSGVVSEVLVKEGDRVEKDAPLARLDPRQAVLQVEQARAAVAQARASYDKLLAGSSTQNLPAADLAIAQAQVDQAEAGLRLAELGQEMTTIKAPMAGTMAMVNVKVGEVVANGPMPHFLIGDISGWRVETTDLTEIDVHKVSRDQPVTVTFEALPDVELTGKVTEVKKLGLNKQGDVVYTAMIALDKLDERLYWNMTAFVTVAD